MLRNQRRLWSDLYVRQKCCSHCRHDPSYVSFLKTVATNSLAPHPSSETRSSPAPADRTPASATRMSALETPPPPARGHSPARSWPHSSPPPKPAADHTPQTPASPPSLPSPPACPRPLPR